MKYLFFIQLIIFTSCAQHKTGVYTTVESYGDGTLTKESPLYFVTENVPMNKMSIIDDCKLAAEDLGVTISETECPNCTYVVVNGGLAGSYTKISSYEVPTINQVTGSIVGSNGQIANYSQDSYGTTSHTRSNQQYSREISLNYFSDKALKKQIHSTFSKSDGPSSAISQVAYAICRASFKDYPFIVKGNSYRSDLNRPEQ